jgi:hypothetical protein
MKKNRSQDQLNASLKRRLTHLMVTSLSKFEETYPELQKDNDAGRFKGTIKTVFNEAIRATSDELNDYEIDYRPLRVNDSAITLTRTFMETVEKVDFVFTHDNIPSILIYASGDKVSVLDAIRAELEVGIVYKEGDELILSIAGIDDCVQVVPAFDKYRMLPEVRERYRNWRKNIVQFYRNRK